MTKFLIQDRVKDTESILLDSLQVEIALQHVVQIALDEGHVHEIQDGMMWFEQLLLQHGVNQLDHLRLADVQLNQTPLGLGIG